MDTRAVPQTQIPHTSKLFQDFLYDFPRTKDFYALPPFAAESFARSVESLHYPDERRASLIKILEDDAPRLPMSPETRRNLDRMAKRGCAAVVTGQQVGLFTGPAFTLYK